MATGLIGSDEYSAGFRWSEPEPHAGTAHEAAAAVAAQIEAQHPNIDWRATVRALRDQNPGA